MDPAKRLVCGTAALGLAYGLGRNGAGPTLMSEAQAVALVRTAFERGIATFDTAPAYGVAEERLGRALENRGTIWTKVGRDGLLGSDPSVAITRSIDDSLCRLNRPVIEMVQWHNWTSSLARHEPFLKAWRTLRKDARVKQVGATTYGSQDALAAVDSGLFDLVQVEFNILNRSVVDAIGKRARDRQVAIAVRSVLLQGVLTDDARTLPPIRRLRDAVERARVLASRLGLRLEQLALQAAFAEPVIDHVLVGFDRIEQLEEAQRQARNPVELPWAEVCALDMCGDSVVDPRQW